MQLIKHIIFSDIGNGNKLMINSLNGLIDKIDDAIYKTITRWSGLNEIVPANEDEAILFNDLQSRGYFVNNYKEEMEIKNKVLEKLRNKHSQIKTSNNITFVMTYDCNFRCSYCFEDKRNKNCTVGRTSKKTAVMTPELIDSAFDLAGDSLNHIGLFGGEPLLPKTRAAFEYIISKAPDKYYYIISNGYYLEEFLDLLVKIKIFHITVTLDGDEKTHDSRRYLANGKPTYKKITSGITKCLESNIPIRIRLNADSINFDEANKQKENFLTMYSDYTDLLSFEIVPLIETKHDEKNDMFTRLYNIDKDFTPAEREKRNYQMTQAGPVLSYFTAGKNLQPVYSFCYAHESGYVVDPYGKIYPCLLPVGVEELAIGIYHPTVEFKENSIRNRSIETIPECKECTYSLLCGGGCPVGLKDYTNIFKPACSSVRNQIHNLLPALYNASTK